MSTNNRFKNPILHQDILEDKIMALIYCPNRDGNLYFLYNEVYHEEELEIVLDKIIERHNRRAYYLGKESHLNKVSRRLDGNRLEDGICSHIYFMNLVKDVSKLLGDDASISEKNKKRLERLIFYVNLVNERYITVRP